MQSKGDGREDSVTDIFKGLVQDECHSRGIDDLIVSVNGKDRHFNADTMFSVCDRFFIVEMKSYKRNIRDEAKKDAVSNLCYGLLRDLNIRNWHRQCHYIMWGHIMRGSGMLETRFDVYEDRVCRTDILPDCPDLAAPFKLPYRNGRNLAIAAAMGQAGLCKPDFFYYLNWLLGERAEEALPVDIETEPFPLTLFGSSRGAGVYGKSFRTYKDLDNWAESALQRKNSRSSPRP